ncbi:hypothetical protein [Paenarthrobacter ureafaciens]|uniref:hypothetical protein n=1 Tax=Paenarthrobacter ureafaciens TaxID=37931 RepID=UPI00140E0F0B|nr:hypothetical protein [Paenarthrobacter ureafaciens]MCX8455358.1 hypothetical protein [Paenarthrobacter ureafaciens]MCY0974085.1 hypothetical protein [Paenarthrobacter ureafaciens]
MSLTIKRPETRVPVCLDGDLVAAHEAAEAEFVAARARSLGDDRLNGGPLKALAQRVADVEAEMKAATVDFLVRGLKRSAWNDLVAAHPPREGNALDKSYGFNLESLMVEAIPACIASVENRESEALPFDPAKDWDPLADDMTDSQYEDFVMAVLRVNKGRNEVPFSLSAYRTIQASDQT